MQAQWTHSAWQAFGQYLGNWATPCCLNRKELRIIYLTAYQEGNAACVKLNEPDIFFNTNKFHKLAVKYKMKTCLFWSHFWLFWKQQILFITYAVSKKKTLTLNKVGPCPSLNGKAIAELRPIRSQSPLTHSRSLLLHGI